MTKHSTVADGFFSFSNKPVTSEHADRIVIWRFSDGRPGHDAQSLGLTEALARVLPVVQYTLPVARGYCAWRELISGRFPAAAGLPDPDLLIGAGRSTHLPLLAARRARGGRTVVLMKPDLPLALFDLCLIPAHDSVRAGARVLTTLGALNRIRPAQAHDLQQGLLLIGGPSRHYGWDDASLISQVLAIVTSQPQVHWQLTTSRRTPDSFLAALGPQAPANVSLVPAADTGPGWLPERLAHAAQVWVSEDSVSMLFEALTAGSRVGALRIPLQRESRVTRGVRTLITTGLVTPFDAWTAGQTLPQLPCQIDETSRCARWIKEHWLQQPPAGQPAWLLP